MTVRGDGISLGHDSAKWRIPVLKAVPPEFPLSAVSVGAPSPAIRVLAITDPDEDSFAVGAARTVFAAAGAQIAWEACTLGTTGSVPEESEDALVRAVRTRGMAFKAAARRGTDVGFRERLGVYARLRLVRNVGRAPGLFPRLDVVVPCGEIETLGAALRVCAEPAKAEALRHRAACASAGAAALTFRHARATGRTRVVLVTAGRDRTPADAIFEAAVRRTSRGYSGVETIELGAESCSETLARGDGAFEVVVAAPSCGRRLAQMFSDLAHGPNVVFGVDFTVGSRLYCGLDRRAADRRSPGIAEGIATILAVALLLRHHGQAEVGERVERAVSEAALVADGHLPGAFLAAALQALNRSAR